jgi:fimbrial chaperone protein
MFRFRTGARAAAMAALGLMGCIAGFASAAQFSLSLTRIHLGASHPVETVVLANQEPRDLAFEVHVQRWHQKADGEWELVPSDALVVHPLILRVPEGGDARVRIGSLSPSVTAEEAYRVELQELPERTALAGGQIRMLTRVSVPVFVEPAKAKPALSLSTTAVASSGVDVVLHNGGTAYAPPSPAVLRVRDANGRSLHEANVTTNYVLAGAQWPLHAALPSTACARAATIELTVGDAAPIIAPVAPGTRRCAP